MASEKTVSDIKFDTFDYPLFKSKLDTNLKELVKETCGLNKFVPKILSLEANRNFLDSTVKEVKSKLDYSKKLPQSNLLDSFKGTPNLSGKSQLVSYYVNSIPVKSKRAPLVTSQRVPAMVNRYDPLALPTNLNSMPVDYSTKIKQFGGDEAYIARQHI